MRGAGGWEVKVLSFCPKKTDAFLFFCSDEQQVTNVTQLFCRHDGDSESVPMVSSEFRDSDKRQVTAVTREASRGHLLMMARFDRNANRLNIVFSRFFLFSPCVLSTCVFLSASFFHWVSLPFLPFSKPSFRRKAIYVWCSEAFFVCQVSTACFFFFFNGPLNQNFALLSDELCSSEPQTTKGARGSLVTNLGLCYC